MTATTKLAIPDILRLTAPPLYDLTLPGAEFQLLYAPVAAGFVDSILTLLDQVDHDAKVGATDCDVPVHDIQAEVTGVALAASGETPAA